MFSIGKMLKIEIKEWECEYCTYINSKSYNICEICSNESKQFHFVNNNSDYCTQNKLEKIDTIFKDKTILPVLSCYSFQQFAENIKEMYNLYINKYIGGIWITSSNSDVKIISDTLKWCTDNYPSLWVGINLVGESIINVLEFIFENKPNGLWIDNSYITDTMYQNIPDIIIDQFKKANWNGLYFGGTLFKYIQQKGDVNKILENSMKYMDVLTTSGNGTGIEIEKQKIMDIHQVCSNKIKIAIASGINEKNIYELSKYSDIFIVGTSLYDDTFNILDEKVISLYNKLHNK